MKTLPNTFIELYDNFSACKGDTVEFKKAAEDLETQFDYKMRAQLVAIRIVRENMVVFTCDDSKWTTYNDDFASANYYDKEGKPCLTAKQAGYYHVRQDVYVMTTDDPNKFFRLINTGERSLVFNQVQLAILDDLLRDQMSGNADWTTMQKMVKDARE